MRTRIISAFPGIGKTYYNQKHPDKCIDSDSSNFSWTKDAEGNNTKERNPDFPQNYIDHIKEKIGKWEFIFVSSHQEIRDAMRDNCLFYYLIYPSGHFKREETKALIIQRYKDRESPQEFIDLLDKNWDAWVESCHNSGIGCMNIAINTDVDMEQEIENILESEKEPEATTG